MPKAIEFDVERVEVITSDQGKVLTFIVDGIARQGKRSQGLRVFMDHPSWLKVAVAMNERKRDD